MGRGLKKRTEVTDRHNSVDFNIDMMVSFRSYEGRKVCHLIQTELLILRKYAHGPHAFRCHCSKFTRKETGEMHLCALVEISSMDSLGRATLDLEDQPERNQMSQS